MGWGWQGGSFGPYQSFEHCLILMFDFTEAAIEKSEFRNASMAEMRTKGSFYHQRLSGLRHATQERFITKWLLVEDDGQRTPKII